MDQLVQAFPETLELVPVSRRPTTLPAETVRAVLARPTPTQRDGAGTAAGHHTDTLTSIIVVTLNNLVFTRLCIESLLRHTVDSRYELIVVDNGSSDGTPDYLRSLMNDFPHVHAIFNACNRGFAAANNQGLERARGTTLVLLNNDTIVPPHWLPRIAKHLEDSAVGTVSPTTNRSGNETELDASYRTYGAFLAFAEQRHHTYQGEQVNIKSLVLFCAAMRRDVWEQVGALDERFEVGMFEDDDYAMRLRAVGYRMVCAEDVFIHHFGQATIGQLSAAGTFGQRFHANRRLWEEKWARPWKAPNRRINPEYEALVQRIRVAVRATLPVDAEAAVVSNGDDAVLSFGHQRARHFPSDADGAFVGYHPRDSAEAITQLEELRNNGVGYLIFPCTAYWWFDYYSEFHKHLARTAQAVVHDAATCAVFALLHCPVDVPAMQRMEEPVA